MRTLYAKLAVVLLGLFCLIGVLYILLTLFTTRMYLQEVNQKLNRTLAEHLVSEKILMKKGQVNDEALKEIFHMLMVINPSIEIYLLDLEGTILAYSAPPGVVKRQRVSLTPLKLFLGDQRAFPILGEDPRDPDREKVFSASPIPLEGPVEGYLYVILGGEEYDSAVQMLQGSYILRLSTWAAAGGLIFALLAGLFLFNLLTRRLKRLSLAMETFRQKKFMEPPEPLDQKGTRVVDEIGEVELTFNQMADRIIRQMKELQETDALRRQLVANVSHDLRTPLAALQGYLETLLLKEGALSPAQQREYLEIAAKHSERLSRLVYELFELAKLDSQEAPPHIEPFSLSELVQDIVQKFQLTAKTNQVRLQANFRGDLPFVSADIGMIERVFENLIENAIRCTPEAGAVTVDLVQGDGRIAICVKDTGCGIPPEELPYIFHRFYKRPYGSGEEKSGGAGLGLAIAKRSLDLHGSSLEVESTPGVGTTFTFHLPVNQA